MRALLPRNRSSYPIQHLRESRPVIGAHIRLWIPPLAVSYPVNRLHPCLRFWVRRHFMRRHQPPHLSGFGGCPVFRVPHLAAFGAAGWGCKAASTFSSVFSIAATRGSMAGWLLAASSAAKRVSSASM